MTAGGLLLLLISPIAPLASLLAALLGGVLSLMQRILSFIAALPMSSLTLYPTERVVLLLYAAFAFVVTAALLRRRSLLMPANIAGIMAVVCRFFTEYLAIFMGCIVAIRMIGWGTAERIISGQQDEVIEGEKNNG